VKGVAIGGDRDITAKLEEDGALALVMLVITRGDENGLECLEPCSRYWFTVGEENVYGWKLRRVMAGEKRSIDGCRKRPRWIGCLAADVNLGPVDATEATLQKLYRDEDADLTSARK
jgi:hypothetical protein